MSRPPEAETSADTLLGGRVRLYQPRRGYRVAIDPVLLAASVAAEPGERVLDAGAGSGAASLCLAARVPGCTLVGLERDLELLELAAANVRANGLATRVALIAGDLGAPPPELRELAFDRVMTNPPYYPAGSASPPGSSTGRAASLATVTVGEWLTACLARLRPRGRLTLIHRADRLDAILAALHGRAGAVAVLPLWPQVGMPARRVIVEARHGARGPLQLLPGLVLHEPDGRYTAAAAAILRDGAPLPVAS